MVRYVAWSEHKKGSNPDIREVAGLLFRWAACGVVMTMIFRLMFKNVAPIIQTSEVMTLLIAVLVSSPFIWGMVFASKKQYLRIRKERSVVKAIIVLSLPVMTAAWVVIIASQHFPARNILAITSVFLVVIYFALFKRLESYYKWLEKAFLSSFEEEEKKEVHQLSGLAPWDSHLVNVIVHPNAIAVNSTLMQANLRSRFGINIVAIQRGMNTIVAPLPNDRILPGDTLVMLGTDEQIDTARPELEIPENIATLFPSTTNYRLRHLRVKLDSPIAGKTIRQSGIREKFHAMVVGIERASNRNINPDTDMKIEPDDVIWIVGEQAKLEELFREN
jgi:CPA2 family monovalent cation:H+ antiporter-2